MQLNKIYKNKMILCCLVALLASATQADRQWIRKQVNWSGPNQSKIKAIHYPEYDVELIAGDYLSVSQQSIASPQGNVLATVIESPPIDGFVPWVAINVTDNRIPEIDGVVAAIVELEIDDGYFTNDPASNYSIGLFDTGASVCIIDVNDAATLGIYDHSYLITESPVFLSGVNDTAIAYASQPMGLFVASLSEIDSNGQLSDANMIGLSNLALAIADPIESPEVPTIIGAPMAVYYNTVFSNSNPITVDYNGQQYTAPDIQVQDANLPVPDYNNTIPLELRPLGATTVQYTYTLDMETFEIIPTSPSLIMGLSSQSLFFVHSVDFYQGEHYAYDRDRFMLDTGAQVTVIGSRVGARLGLDPQNAEFQVEIEGATGETQMIDGFYIDRLEIPALGQWLTFTDVPVILLDVASPEGGSLDGIIGMNLFTELNFVLKGGGLFLQGDPYLTFETANLDPPEFASADFNQDSSVNFKDFSLFAPAWQSQLGEPSYNSQFDISNPADETINLQDLKIIAEKWLNK